MTNELFLAQFETWIADMRRIASDKPGTGACTLATAMTLWLWTLNHLQSATDPDGGKLYVTCRDSVTIIDPVSKTVTGSVLIQGAHKGIAIASVDVYAPEPTQGPTALPTQAQPTAAVATPTAVPSPGLNVTATPQPGAGVSPTPVPPAGSDNTLLYVIFGGGIAFFVLVAGRNYQGRKK
jgi:YVTN family beta-propeller protein